MSEVIDTYGWSKRTTASSDAENADQAEAEAIAQLIVATAVAMHDERLAEELETDSVPATRIEEQLRADVELDSLSGRLLEEIERRADLLGELYPFRLEDGSLVYTPSRSGVYEFCLAVSTAPNVTTGAFTELARYFEILAADVVCHYLGEGSAFVRSGAPAYPPDSTIKTFEDAVKHLDAHTGEWPWCPTEDAEIDSSFIKDEGMDFVVWKTIDRRRGRLFVLGQCACGRSDWHEKTGDLDLDKLRRWIRELPPVAPIRAFATPHCVTGALVFQNLSRLAGLSFDRVRLTSLANSPHAIEHFRQIHTPTLLRLARLVIPNAIVSD